MSAYLIDGHSLTFKAYYAIRRLTTPSGEPIGAVYGFMRTLLRFIADRAPERLAVVFDTGRPTFRKDLYPDYKANREAPPPDFGVQMEWIGRLLAAMRIPTFSLDGFEADDLIATMAERLKRDGEVGILSADKDLFQLVDDRVRVLRPEGKALSVMDAAAVEAKLGARPDQVVDWLALVGDSSDNIPGVPGIGPKSAVRLLAQFQTLDALLARVEEVERPRWREALQTHADRARLARRLATVRRDVPLDWTPEACRLPDDLWSPDAVNLMRALGFESILSDYGVAADAAPPAAEAEPASETAAPRYLTIRTEAQLAEWVAAAVGAPWLALDTETTSTDALRADLVGISLSCRADEAIYIPIGHRPEVADGAQLTLDVVARLLAPLLDEPATRLTAHHAKYDWKVLRRAGLTLAPPAFDTMIASYLLDPDRPQGHGLKALAAAMCGVTMTPIRELIGSGASAITMAEVAVADAAPYAARDADVTLRLTERFAEELARLPALERLMREVELPLVSVLMDMEIGGFTVDVACLHRLKKQLAETLSDLGRRIWEAAGHPFNIASPKQLSQVLFEELGLPPGRKTKTGYSTNEAELERLAPLHPIAQLMLEYRASEKLQSTYVDALPKMVHAETGRVHTSFNQTIAATGRLSSTSPNLQNIPIRTEMGRAIRRAFVPDRPDHRLLKADYSQIELRILAHVSRDAALCAAYKEGRDIHRQTAAQIFGVALDDVTREMRAQAKTVNFGVIYGISAHGLARQLGIGRGQAADFIERYFSTYPGVREWVERLLEEARRTGCVETLLGRRRWVRDLGVKNQMIRQAAERVAVNSPIQGTSADMIKRAMIRVHEGLAEAAPGARLVCQVHDELVLSVPVEHEAAASRFVRRAMVEALPLSVPIEVDIHGGAHWAEC